MQHEPLIFCIMREKTTVKVVLLPIFTYLRLTLRQIRAHRKLRFREIERTGIIYSHCLCFLRYNFIFNPCRSA